MDKTEDTVGLLDYSKHKIKLVADSYAEKAYRISSCKREPLTVEWIESMPKNSCFWDIGANIGWYSLNFNNLKNVEKVYSFEPIPRTYKYLTSHIDLNEAKKISPHNLALYNKKGEIEFFWTKKETGSSSMKNIQERKLYYPKLVLMTKTI